MLAEVVANVSVPTPVLKPRVPVSDPTKLAVPTDGAVWLKVSVKFPLMAGPAKLAGTVVVTTRSPNGAPAGVLTESVVPLNVIVVVPFAFVKLTMVVPLTLKTPVVLKVTGSAVACDAHNNATTAISNGRNNFLLISQPPRCCCCHRLSAPSMPNVNQKSKEAVERAIADTWEMRIFLQVEEGGIVESEL